MKSNPIVIALLVVNTAKAINTNQNLQEKVVGRQQVASTMTDDDVKCYIDRYPFDVNNTVDAR